MLWNRRFKAKLSTTLFISNGGIWTAFSLVFTKDHRYFNFEFNFHLSLGTAEVIVVIVMTTESIAKITTISSSW